MRSQASSCHSHRQRVATNAVRLAAAVLLRARRSCDLTARQLLTHLMKPLAFQILAKVRVCAGLRPLQARLGSPSDCEGFSELSLAASGRHAAQS